MAEQNQSPVALPRIDGFLLKRADRYKTLNVADSSLPGSRINIFVPQSELSGSEREVNYSWYKDTVADALKLNCSVFGYIPAHVNAVFVTTTEEFNELTESGKVVGDNIVGQGYPDIVAFTPVDLNRETSVSAASPSKEIKTVVKHEATHNFINSKYGLPKTDTIPGWVWEGIPMVVCLDFSGNDTKGSWVKRIYQTLKTSSVSPPTNEWLENTFIQDRKATLRYGFGQQFLLWLVQRELPQGTEIEQKKLLSAFLDNGFAGGDRFVVDEALQSTFHMTYGEAYGQFMDYLEKATR